MKEVFGVQEGDKVDIWVESYCPINPGIGGYAALLRHNDEVREMVGGYALTTNNRITSDGGNLCTGVNKTKLQSHDIQRFSLPCKGYKVSTLKTLASR